MAKDRKGDPMYGGELKLRPKSKAEKDKAAKAKKAKAKKAKRK